MRNTPNYGNIERDFTLFKEPAMQLTSLPFLFFMAAVFAVNWALPPRFRWAAALCASALFYALLGAGPFAVLCLCCLICFFGGLFLARRQGSRAALWVVLAAALLPLLLFKYTSLPSRLSLIVPLGISFYTFKAVSYLVQVSRGALPAKKHFGHLALYLSFFPEVTSGPIQRPEDLLSQIERPTSFSYEKALSGAQLILWGLFKKIVLADNLAYYVDYGFARPDVVMGASLILAAFLYAIQIYCDFSGYSDIAIGCMELLGYRVPENFKSPYLSGSVKEFWARWHISLSSFLKDYIYIPLGGNRCGPLRQALNLLLTFLISGIWHGAGATFVVWGGLHGFYQVVGRFTKKGRDALYRALHLSQTSLPARAFKIGCTFLLVSAAFVFFRADSLSAALHIFARMPDSFSFSLQTFKNAAAMLTLNLTMVIRLVVFGLVLCWVDLKTKETGYTPWLRAKSKLFQILFCYFLAFAILFFGIAGSGNFIYFKF